jgi:hypothetical protein
MFELHMRHPWVMIDLPHNLFVAQREYSMDAEIPNCFGGSVDPPILVLNKEDFQSLEADEFVPQSGRYVVVR